MAAQDTMRGVVFRGDRVAEVIPFPMPQPGPGEVLIQLNTISRPSINK